MKVYPINNTGIYRKNLYSNNNCGIDKENYKNPSFKGFAVSALVALVAKNGVAALKGNKTRRFLIDLEEHVQSSNQDKYKESLRALVKTPNSYKPPEIVEFFSFLIPSADIAHDVDTIRYSALEKIHVVNDETISNIQLKKDFLNSMIQNGHNISPLFVKQLKKLPDSKYKGFKEELVDTVLHSTTYNEKRRNYLNEGYTIYSDWLPGGYSLYFSPCAYPTVDKVKGTTLIIAYEDLKLIESLDKDVYQKFLQSKSPQIKSLSGYIKNQMALDYKNNWQPKSSFISDRYECSDEYLMKQLRDFYRKFLTEYPN